MTPGDSARPRRRTPPAGEPVEEPTSDEAGPVKGRVITDPRTMRALAHPVRLALLEALGREGELTATRAGELLDESPGNMSWHLQTLAKYGYVEEAGGGKGRSRPWRIASVSNTFKTSSDDPAGRAASDALENVFADEAFSRLRTWVAQRAGYSTEWRSAAFTVDAISYLTHEEMSALGEEIGKLLDPYQARIIDRSLRPVDAEPVKIVAFGHPIPPTPAGN